MRRVPSLLPLALLVAALAAGCGPKGTLRPNVPPQTTLFVQGPVDTVNHVVHLYWFGSDVDGDVRGFELRFVGNPQAPADTQWAFTTRTDSVFTLHTGDTRYIAPRFEVRAIDDAGLRDPTPAFEDFQFSNQPPSLQFTIAPFITDTTFYSLTLQWNPIDPDGDTSRMTFRVWLNGNSANPRLATGNGFTIPSADFLAGDSAGAGTRTAYVQPIDDGGLAGAVFPVRWQVRRPVAGSDARLLVIDDVPGDEPGAAGMDGFFATGLTANLPADTYSILRLESSQPFRSAQDVAQTFGLFRAVLWYRGAPSLRPYTSKTPTGSIPLMRTFEAGISDYLRHGGRLMLEGTNTVIQDPTNGLLDYSFVSDHFGSDALFRRYVFPDSLASWGVGTTTVFQSPLLADSVKFLIGYGGIRAWVVRDTADVVFWASPGVLTEGNPIRMPVVIDVPQPSGGRAIVVPFRFNSANAYSSAQRVFGKLLQRLGVSP